MAAVTMSTLVDVSPESADSTSTSPEPSLAAGQRSPRHKQNPLHVMTDAQSRRQERHSKRLSINFPILVPSRADTPTSSYTASPTASSAYTTTNHTFYPPMSTQVSHGAVPSSIALPMPLTPPSELEQPPQLLNRARSVSKGHGRQASTSTEFLTLLASQERKVLELKDELLRAETELTSLKKQWALYEANKKKGEAKGVPVRMNSVRKSHTRAQSVVEAGTGLGLTGLEEPASEEQLEAERERRREEARERLMGRLPTSESANNGNGATRKNGQRVFQNSRHTRTLSLLTSTSGTKSEQTGSLDSESDTKPSSLDSPRRSTVNSPVTTNTATSPSLTRTNSGLEGLNLGKTYKDLANAASRKNLPQSLSPEQFVKHGKQVVDGVRDGLWTFFEDIRQATVGEEAIHGGNGGVRRQPSVKTQDNTGNAKLKRSPTDAGKKSGATKDQKASDSSFWKEFGMDTPKSDKTKRDSIDQEKRPSLPGRWPSTKTGSDFQQSVSTHSPKPDAVAKNSNRKATRAQQKKERAEHHESKSSTDSRNPPSLLADLLGDDEEEGWDNWDSNTDHGSPQSARKRQGRHTAKSSIDVSVDGNEDKSVQWHDLMS